MGCTASKDAQAAGSRAVVATPSTLKGEAGTPPTKEIQVSVQTSDELKFGNNEEEEEKSSNDETVDPTTSLEERTRALSAANTQEKLVQISEAQQVAEYHDRRKLTLLGTRDLSKQDGDEVRESVATTEHIDLEKTSSNSKTKKIVKKSKSKNKVKRGLGRLSKKLSSSAQNEEAEIEDDSDTLIRTIGDGGIGNGATGFAQEALELPVTYSVLTRPGNDPQKKRKENQDAYCVIDEFGGSRNMCVCVYDGHGPYGAQASGFVRDQIPQDLLQANIQDSSSREEIEQILHDTCVSVNDRLGMSDIDVYVSGSTGVIGYLNDNVLYVANVGDSRAVLGSRNADNSGFSARDLSFDHKPDRVDENQRIIQSGGRVFEWGVPRVWKRDVDMPGLAMSRSFGDLAAESVGVFAEPEITCTELGANDAFVVFASDGVWEFLNSQEVVRIVGEILDSGKSREQCHEAAIKCIQESVKLWKDNEDVIDDSTIVILFTNFSAPQEQPNQKGA